MKDLTTGPIGRQLLAMAIPISIGMLVQTAYLMVDLYFVAGLGSAALAGSAASGNILFVVMALTQMVGAGTVALVARAVGRKEQAEAELVVNQSLSMALLCVGFTLTLGYVFAADYMALLGSDAATQTAGLTYLRWFTPGLALQFASVVMGSALRGTGVVNPGLLVQMVTVLLNLILAPVLIGGWGTGHAMGVAGAGLASSISVGVGTLLLAAYFFKPGGYIQIAPRNMRPDWKIWKRVLNIGFPAGAEFGFTFIFMSIVYGAISTFGASAMAGFGVGSRIMQAIFLPGMGIAFALPAIAGQNLGAGKLERVRQTMRWAFALQAGVMLLLTFVCKLRPELLVGAFSREPQSASVATTFLMIVSWNFVASGVISVCSGLFQAMENTWPIIVSTAFRIVTFALPVAWMVHRPRFAIEDIWHLSVGSVLLQMLLSLTLLRQEWIKTHARPHERLDACADSALATEA